MKNLRDRGLQSLQKLQCPQESLDFHDGGTGRVLAVDAGMEIQRDPLVTEIISCAIQVHQALGPGLYESAYRPCFAFEMKSRGIRFQTEVSLPLVYKEVKMDCGYRVDFVVEDRVVVEIKAVDHLLPIHQAQVMTYLKLLKMKQGLLMNFNAPLLTKGLRSILLS